MAKDKNGKLAPEIVSLGDAFMDHCERHHNTGAFTPSYLQQDGQVKAETLDDRLNAKIKELEKTNSISPMMNEQGKNNVLKQIDIVQSK